MCIRDRAAAEALAKPGLWRHHLPGADDSCGERSDDAGGGGRGYAVLGAGAELIPGPCAIDMNGAGPCGSGLVSR